MKRQNGIWLLAMMLLFVTGCEPAGYRLLEAIEGGEATAVREMLEKGVPADAPPEGDRRLPLEVAATFNQAEIVQMLIGFGAHPDSARTVLSPLWAAIDQQAEAAAVALLEGGARADGPLRNGISPLMEAVLLGQEKVLVALIGAGAEVNPAAPKSRPFTEAVASGNLSLVQTLLDHGANPSLTDAIGEPPLFTAFGLDSLAMARLLLDRGADINEVDANGWSIAFLGEEIPADHLAQALEWGLNLEQTDKWGDTPLHNAVQNRLLKVAETLLELGADPNARNAKGETTARAAQGMEHPEMVALLTGSGGRIR